MPQTRISHPAPFPPTQWSMVQRAAGAGTELRRAALGELLRRYLPAMHAHLVLDKDIPAHAAEDLLQGFVSDKLIEQNLLAQAQREKGKLRSLLLATLDHYVISEIRRQKAHKRCPRGGHLPLEEQYCPPAAQAGPSEQFDEAWGRQVLAEALRRMNEECAAHRRMQIWAIFDARIVRPAYQAAPPMPYEQLVQQMKLKTPLAACNLLITAKRMFVRHLRAVVGEYVDEARQIDAEIQHLQAVLSRAGA